MEKCNKCNTSLTWIPVMGTYFCTNCEKITKAYHDSSIPWSTHYRKPLTKKNLKYLKLHNRSPANVYINKITGEPRVLSKKN